MNEPALEFRRGPSQHPPVTLFLLAHQDDELGFAPLIARALQQGRSVRVLYLTDGGAHASARRGAESVRALTSLGVAESQIRFLGTGLAVPDGQLFRHFPAVYQGIESDCRDIRNLAEVFTLAWEGGHPDHDATHVLAMKLANDRAIEDRTWQLPFYRAANHGPPFFSMFAPLECNGPAWQLTPAREGAWLRARMVHFYPSQWRTFVGLAPAIFWHALIGTPTRVQQVQVRRSLERPTAGPLLYERRSHIAFAELADHARRFLAPGDAGAPGT